MTPQLQQAIKLLQLNRLELAQHCMTEMLENPVLEESLEEVDQRDIDADKKKKLEEERVKEVDTKGTEEIEGINWDNYISHQSNRQGEERGTRYQNPDLPSYEATLTRASTLAEHLTTQLKLTRMDDQELTIGATIIGNLNEDGYLKLSLQEIADKHKVSYESAEDILLQIQEFDPVGVGCRDLQECLLIQSRQIPNNILVKKLIRDHLKDLENKNHTAISKATGYSREEIQEAVKVIGTLEPKPGRQFYDESSQYITPDIYVYKGKDDFLIVLNEDGLPKLRISQLYQNLLKDQSSKGFTKDYINDKLRSALWLIRSIHQRQRTIYKVTESIVKMQRPFLEEGISALKPMVLRNVADDIGMHESTVSRVTTNKYVHTPQGIFELKFFFNSGIRSVEGAGVASEAVKEKIRDIILSEDSRRPYSDQELVELLRKQNIDIARRTIAKYREMLGILSSSRRKQPF
ncbi:MAG: RNA polymerase factor sigma-54 [Bdellovibrionales bacterium]|nr:RNA polymerase factor sigma-54 [Bdellovibrionales bacterium]